MSDVNLIPVWRLVGKRRKARLYLWAAVCGVYACMIAAGSLTFHIAHAGEGRGMTEQLEAADKQIEQDNRTMLGLRRQLAETNTALETTKAIHDQPDWSKLLRGLSAQLGEEIVLSRYQLTTLTADNKVITVEGSGSLPATPLGTFLTECRHTLTLNGFGKSQESVSQFVLRLEGSGVFNLVRLVNSSRQTFLNGEAVAFSVECHFSHGHPARGSWAGRPCCLEDHYGIANCAQTVQLTSDRCSRNWRVPSCVADRICDVGGSLPPEAIRRGRAAP
jgi:Tfp pilus assembly protein PilN